MFMFITEIFTSHNSQKQVNLPVSDTETSFESFQLELCKIHSDFITMKTEFNELFENMLRDHKEKMIDSHLMIPEVENFIGTEVLPIVTPLEEFLRIIFFKKFLLFFDEYSYFINSKIINLYNIIDLNVIREMQYENKNFRPPEPIHKDFNDFCFIKYLDFEFFLTVLEKKVTDIFEITLLELRQKLYGFDDPNFTQSIKKVLLFYETILCCKTLSKKISLRAYDCTVEPTKLNKHEEDKINDAISKCEILSTLTIPELYTYHLNILNKGHVTETRFLDSKNLSDIPTSTHVHSSKNHGISDINHEDMKPTSNLKNLKPFDLFKHVAYSSDINIYRSFLNQMRDTILFFYRVWR